MTDISACRPDIDAISMASYDIHARKPRGGILDSEVKDVANFSKVSIPISHMQSGRGKNQSVTGTSAGMSAITNKLSESSRSGNSTVR